MYREITELQPHLEEALGGDLSGVPIEIGRTHGGLTMLREAPILREDPDIEKTRPGSAERRVFDRIMYTTNIRKSTPRLSRGTVTPL